MVDFILKCWFSSQDPNRQAALEARAAELEKELMLPDAGGDVSGPSGLGLILRIIAYSVGGAAAGVGVCIALDNAEAMWG